MKDYEELIKDYQGKINELIEKRNPHGNLDKEDLYQVACIGVIQAMQLYEQNPKNTLKHYIKRCVDKELIKYVNENSRWVSNEIPMDKSEIFLTYDEIETSCESVYRNIKPIIDKCLSKYEYADTVWNMWLQGYSNKDISLQTGISTQQVQRNIVAINDGANTLYSMIEENDWNLDKLNPTTCFSKSFARYKVAI